MYYGLDLECSPKGSCVEGLTPRLVVLLGGARNFRRWGLVGGSSSLGGMYVWLLTSLSLSFCASQLT
jgi:hypothetical protein